MNGVGINILWVLNNAEVPDMLNNLSALSAAAQVIGNLTFQGVAGLWRSVFGAAKTDTKS